MYNKKKQVDLVYIFLWILSSLEKTWKKLNSTLNDSVGVELYITLLCTCRSLETPAPEAAGSVLWKQQEIHLLLIPWNQLIQPKPLSHGD